MRATWTFKAVRHGCERRALTRNGERGTRNRTLEGTEGEALEFARRACEYLRPKGVESVEAWSVEIQNAEFKIKNSERQIENLVRFCLKPHRNGQDWIAEPNELHHGGWWTDLRQAIDYALFRGSGKICAVEIWNPRIRANSQELKIQQVVLVDRTGQDACPTRGVL